MYLNLCLRQFLCDWYFMYIKGRGHQEKVVALCGNVTGYSTYLVQIAGLLMALSCTLYLYWNSPPPSRLKWPLHSLFKLFVMFLKKGMHFPFLTLNLISIRILVITLQPPPPSKIHRSNSLARQFIQPFKHTPKHKTLQRLTNIQTK